MKNFLGQIRDGIREDLNNRLDDEFIAGHNKAANICVESITKRIDELYKKIKDGKSLSAQEQFLLAQLDELKKEIVDRLRS